MAVLSLFSQIVGMYGSVSSYHYQTDVLVYHCLNIVTLSLSSILSQLISKLSLLPFRTVTTFAEIELFYAVSEETH